MQSTTNPRKCQLFLNVFSATLQGSLSLARHVLLLLGTPFHLETERPLESESVVLHRFEHFGEPEVAGHGEQTATGFQGMHGEVRECFAQREELLAVGRVGQDDINALGWHVQCEFSMGA